MYSLFAKFLISLLIIYIAFKIVKISLYIKTVCVFYLASFTLGGGLLAIMYFTGIGEMSGTMLKNGVFYFNLPFGTVVITSAIAYILITVFCRAYKANKSISYKDVSVYVDGKCINFRALVDTGNMLSDPISNMPVMIVESKKLKSILPDDFFEILNTDITDTKYASSKIRLIPYASLGEKSGMLIGFKPDEIIISGEIKDNVIIGVYNDTLSSKCEYDALLNPEILLKT